LEASQAPEDDSTALYLPLNIEMTASPERAVGHILKRTYLFMALLVLRELL
jgi:hypothetical protein